MCSMFHGRLLTILFFHMLAMMKDPYLLHHLQNSFLLCEFTEAPHLLNHLQHCNLTFAGMLAINSSIVVFIFNVFFLLWLLAGYDGRYLFIDYLQHSFLLFEFTVAAHLLYQLQQCNLTFACIFALILSYSCALLLLLLTVLWLIFTIVFFHMLGVMEDPYLLHHLQHTFLLWLLIYWNICNIATSRLQVCLQLILFFLFVLLMLFPPLFIAVCLSGVFFNY